MPPLSLPIHIYCGYSLHPETHCIKEGIGSAVKCAEILSHFQNEQGIKHQTIKENKKRN